MEWPGGTILRIQAPSEKLGLLYSRKTETKTEGTGNSSRDERFLKSNWISDSTFRRLPHLTSIGLYLWHKHLPISTLR
eukprot:6175579-Pleurochrysis_carterae.AAC.2